MDDIQAEIGRIVSFSYYKESYMHFLNLMLKSIIKEVENSEKCIM